MKKMTIVMLALAALCLLANVSRADLLFDQDQYNSTQNRQNSRYDSGWSNYEAMADDFSLATDADITAVYVRGNLTSFGSGFRVSIYANTGTGDASYPTGAPIYSTGTLSYVQSTDQYQITLPTAFSAAANTTYWLSVQGVVIDSVFGETFQWNWNMDQPHPSSYSPNGSAAVNGNSSGPTWGQHWGRWWDPGDAFDPSGWRVQGYSGTQSPSISVSGTLGSRTAIDGQRMDLNFQLIGTPTSVPEPSSMVLAAFGLSLVGGASYLKRRRRA